MTFTPLLASKARLQMLGPCALMLLTLAPTSCGGSQSLEGYSSQGPEIELHADGAIGELPRLDKSSILYTNPQAEDLTVSIATTKEWLTHDCPPTITVPARSSLKVNLRIRSHLTPATPGTYEATLRIAQSSSGAPLLTASVSLSLGPSQETWRAIKSAPESRVVYVSATEGDDANSGLSAQDAKKTITSGMQLIRAGYPDHLLLRRGDTWNERIGDWRASGRSPNEPAVISSYGTEQDRPKLLCPSTGLSISRAPVQHLIISGIQLTATARGYSGIEIMTTANHVLLEDLFVSDFKDNIVLQSYGGKVENVTVSNSTVVDSHYDSGHSQGLYAAGVDGLAIAGCLFDHNGWVASSTPYAPTMFNHNIYIDDSCGPVELTGSIIARASSHGAHFRAGGEVSHNLFLRNAINLQVGYKPGAKPQGVEALVCNNIFQDGRDITSSIPRRWGMQLKNIREGTVADNILVQCPGGGYQRLIELSTSDGVGVNSLSISDNLAIEWGAPIAITGTRYSRVRLGRNEVTESRSILMHTDGLPAGNALMSFGNRLNPNGTPTPYYAGSRMTLTPWKAAVHDTTSWEAPGNYKNPSYNIETYTQTHAPATSPTLEAFLAQARERSKFNWSKKLTARQCIEAFRAAYSR